MSVIYFMVWPMVQDKLVERPAGEFNYINLEGYESSLSSNLGEPVILHFWATWCSVCLHEMPEFKKLEKEFKVINIAGHSGSGAEVKRFALKNNMNLGSVVNDFDKKIMQLYGVRAFPTTVIVDAKGVVRVFNIGKMSAQEVKAKISKF